MVSAEFRVGLIQEKVILRRHAAVGAHTMILPGVEMQEGAAIGACSFLLPRFRCREWTFYFGIPAKKVSERSRDALRLEQEFLESLQS